MMESAVQLLHLVQSMRVTVTVALNAKETLPVGQTIVLHLFHLMRIAVKFQVFMVRFLEHSFI